MLNMMQVSELRNLLHNFVTNTLNVRGAVLMNSGGSSLISAFSCDLDEKELVGTSAIFFSWGIRIGEKVNVGEMERIIVEGVEGYYILVSCRNDVILLIFTDKDLIRGWLFLEIKRLVKNINLMC